jgi:hypothetical protein
MEQENQRIENLLNARLHLQDRDETPVPVMKSRFRNGWQLLVAIGLFWLALGVLGTALLWWISFAP